MLSHSLLKELSAEIYKWENTQLICNLVINAAAVMKASDIHIEPLSGFVRIRYRIDWVLYEAIEYQQFLHSQIVARYKILANLKIDESRMPQDGRISITLPDKSLDLRVSTLPTVHGEKIVMRIVDKSKKIPSISDLGIEGKNGRLLQKAIGLPNGIILTSWPTWSGKSTTLYSCLTSLNHEDVNIMTIEDPVENVIDGVNQSQIFPDIGYTFAGALRTALRQDPDIIMVGEIRDHETINIAIEAALTGHLVLSTIHTNSAAETLTRILNMGIQPFLLPAAINAIIAQRLVRRLCKNCRKPVKADTLPKNMQTSLRRAIARTDKQELIDRISPEILARSEFYEAVWCEQCNHTGYLGRVGIYEILEITLPIKELILSGASATMINERAIDDGMISLEQDGIIKALLWHTSLEEVYAAAKEGN